MRDDGRSRTSLPSSTARSSQRRSRRSCARRRGSGCGSVGPDALGCVCSTSGPAARRGRSRCSSSHPAARASSTTLPGVLDDAGRSPRRAWPVRSCRRCAPGDFHDDRHRARARTTSWCSGTCAAPRATTGAESLVRRAFAALRPGGELLIADYFADNDRKHNPFGVQMGLTMLANTATAARSPTSRSTGWLRDRRLRVRSGCSNRSASTSCTSRRDRKGASNERAGRATWCRRRSTCWCTGARS